MRIRRRSRTELESVVAQELDIVARRGYDDVVATYVEPEHCSTIEVAGASGQVYTLHIEAWWEDEVRRTVHLSVVANRGSGLRYSGKGSWCLLEPPVDTAPPERN